MSATIRDVAKAARVAVSTVSRVLNGSGYVSANTRERVEKAIAELDFRPNMLARGLISRNSNTLALILPDLANPFYSPLVRGVEAEAKAAGYSVFICDTEYNDAEVGAWVNRLRGQWVNGILFAVEPRLEDLQGLLEDQTPFVMIDQDMDEHEADRILINHRAGARAAVQYLTELGHRRIGHIAGPRRAGFERFRGYLEALHQAGIEPNPDWISEHGDFTLEHGYKAMKSLLELSPSRRPTAVFAVNDMEAVGALRAIEEAGLRVPDDISLVGYDDIVWASLLKPALTTCRQPVEAIGRMTTQLLLRRVAGDSTDPAQKLTLDSELCIRESTAPPRA